MEFENLRQFVEEKMTERDIPGLAAGVYSQGETSVAGFDVTNVDPPPAGDR